MKITVRNFPRLDDDGVKEMAKGIVTGRRWVYKLNDPSTTTAAMWLCLGTTFSQPAAKLVGALVGDTGRVAGYLNGQPMTVGGWIVHRDDWARVVDKWKQIEEAMK